MLIFVGGDTENYTRTCKMGGVVLFFLLLNAALQPVVMAAVCRVQHTYGGRRQFWRHKSETVEYVRLIQIG